MAGPGTHRWQMMPRLPHLFARRYPSRDQEASENCDPGTPTNVESSTRETTLGLLRQACVNLNCT
eukprot:1273048-Lingulodinium_polyedra.AAC.1